MIAWQRTHGRHHLPWQNTRDPYRVWLSEVMLQQTQVSTVLGYYKRFLARFPDVRALAAAPLDDVLALWSGLGYYSRARLLHRCAQVVVAEHAGAFPATSAGLEQLPGIGRSTAAAIAAFCFGERVAILDGNVKRVLARVLAFDVDLASGAEQKRLWQHATDLLPAAGIERYTQGLMDLGAGVCHVRTPACTACPLRVRCAAAASGEPERYPFKTRRLRRGTREAVWLQLEWRGSIWLVRRDAKGVWGGLWSLPEFASAAEFDAATHGWPGSATVRPSFTHVLTHLDWTLHPVRWVLPEATAEAAVSRIVDAWPSGRWFANDAAPAAGIPAPLRRLLEEG
ncbi:A/G-specific adenine glycosylase [Piscinibacter koreensis]|uniref:Adenine DNA glycosylase n=1 Tax=Piscinibacter koreensis TaxID=2742824 RepID=A0A7Y6NNX8_9BURK|nr:A/G-specific adenine glycosylase [Schlegelella koreensis]